MTSAREQPTVNPGPILRAASGLAMSEDNLRAAVGELHDLVWWGVCQTKVVDTRRPLSLLTELVERLGRFDAVAGGLLDWWIGAIGGEAKSTWYARDFPEELREAILVESQPPDLATEARIARFDQEIDDLTLMVDQVRSVSYIPLKHLIQRVSKSELLPVIEKLRAHEAPSDSDLDELDQAYAVALAESSVDEGSRNWQAARTAVEERVESARALTKRVRSLRVKREFERMSDQRVEDLAGFASEGMRPLCRQLLATVGDTPTVASGDDLRHRWDALPGTLADPDQFRLWWLGEPLFLALSTGGASASLTGFCEGWRKRDTVLRRQADELAPRATDGDEMRELVLLALDTADLSGAVELLEEMDRSATIEAARLRAKELVDRADERGVTHQRINDLRNHLAAGDFDHLQEMIERVEETAGMADRTVPATRPAAPELESPVHLAATTAEPQSVIIRSPATTLDEPLLKKPATGYVIRVNAHNQQWNGSICSNPVRNTRCQSNESFKVDFCGRNEPRCSWISVFAERPRVDLGFPFTEEYRPVVEFDQPTRGDVFVFWTDTGSGQQAVGLWRLETFGSTPHGWVGTADPATAVLFPPGLVAQQSIIRRSSQKSRSRAVHYMDQSALEAFLTELRDLYRDRVGTDPIANHDLAVIELLLDEQRTRVDPHVVEPPSRPDKPPARIVDAAHDPSPDVVAPSPTVQDSESTEIASVVDRQDLREQLEKSGVFYTDRQLDRYVLAVREARLVVLAGPSGVGKTRLVAETAAAVGAEFELIAVRPDFRANESLLGYLPPFPNAVFSSTPTAHFIARAHHEEQSAAAEGRPPRPFHLCLDEMNLARPEHYMSELLSKMEITGGEIRFHHGGDSVGFPASIVYPQNLVIIGTVNLDESTFPLTGKVLDRAAYLELDADRLSDFLQYATAGLDLVPWISQLIVDIDAILDGARQGLGYRVAGRIIDWCRLGADSGWVPDVAVDGALCAMVWPRLSFGRADPSDLEALETLTRRIREARGDLPDSERVLDRMLAELRTTDLAFGQTRLS